MDWAQDFYAKQGAWTGVYAGEPTEYNHSKVAAIARLAGAGLWNILELGAGGGQNAAATAALGHEVTALELVPAAADNAHSLAQALKGGTLKVVQGDFYQVELEGSFHVITYWDGFGVGSDEDQRSLLRRMTGWLRPGGCILIDIYMPTYAAASAGHHMVFDGAERRYGFDAEGCRWLDHWWQTGHKEEMVTQSLRAYTPADLRLLLQDTNLELDSWEPGGGMDWDAGQWRKKQPLERAMSYLAKLVAS
jgi:SAM-dependent methyltransferase